MITVKISTKGRYGLRLMFDLALHYGKGMTPLKEIAKRQEISDKYLEQIIMQLNRAGLVRSVRGSQGGYSLREAPDKILVGDVLRAVEGSLAPVECLDEPGSCPNADLCVTVTVWRKVREAIESVVDHMTLQDLVDDYLAKGQSDYCI